MNTPYNLLNGILESSRESVIFALDNNYLYLTFNRNHQKTMKAIWGVDIEVGANMLNYIKEEKDREKAKANFDRALNGESFTAEEQYGDGNLGRRWYRNEYNPLYDDNGHVIGLTVFLTDITESKKAEEKLKQKTKEYETIFEGSRAALSLIEVIDEETFVYIRSNQMALELSGLRIEEVIGKTPFEILGDKIGAEVKARYQKCLQEKASLTYEEKLPLPTGERVWYTTLTPILNEEGKVTHIVDSGQDITERKQIEKNFLNLVENSPDMVVRFDTDLRHIFVNSTAEEYLGLSRDDLIGKTYDDIYKEFSDKRSIIDYSAFKKMNAKLKDCLKTREEQEVYNFIRGKYFHGRMVPELNEEGEIQSILAVTRDVTEQKKAEEKIRYLSFYDSLTGLYNRAYFDAEMGKLNNKKNLPLSVIMVDLNGLKLVNDTYGHDVGDEVLKTVAKILKKSFRKEEVVARFGGDEFVILLPKTSAEVVETKKKELKNKCQGAYIKDVPVSLAMGSSTKYYNSESINKVIRKAEDNMYKEKLASSQSARSAILNTLLKALEAKSYETKAHTRRMLMFAWKIGEKLRLTESELSRLQLLITLHDIGKTNIPEEILTKKAPLNEKEWDMIKEHPEIGYRIARATEEFAHVAEDILAHHERWDGKGYPKGLKGREIPLLARITAIADAYEVMSNGRPYKEPLSKEQIIAELKRCRGSQFDPELVDIFLEVLED